MKLILIVALLGLCNVNGLPTEETLKSMEGDSDFDETLPKGRSGYVWVKNKSSRVDYAFTNRLEEIGRDGIGSSLCRFYILCLDVANETFRFNRHDATQLRKD